MTLVDTPARTDRFDELVERARALAAGRRRAVLGIAGAPGAGKTTVALALVRALAATPPDGLGPGWVAHVPMDGFHLADVELDRLGRRHLTDVHLRPARAGGEEGGRGDQDQRKGAHHGRQYLETQAALKSRLKKPGREA